MTVTPLRAKRCKDCPPESKRPIKGPGPRCATHHRAELKRQKLAAHGRAVANGYGITIDEYWRIYDAQGRRCAICQRARGKTKRLCVDHDHTTGEVRGLLCTTCNRILLGQYDTAALLRAIEYLHNPPARQVLPPRI